MEFNMDKLIRNAFRTPDGTILTSHSRHDYKSYTDANGSTYMIDGGLDYVRGSNNGDEECLCVYSSDSFAKRRLAATWGTRGINGDQPLEYKRVADMSIGHLVAVLDTQICMYPQIKQVILEELEYRGQPYSGIFADPVELSDDEFEALVKLFRDSPAGKGGWSL